MGRRGRIAGRPKTLIIGDPGPTDRPRVPADGADATCRRRPQVAAYTDPVTAVALQIDDGDIPPGDGFTLAHVSDLHLSSLLGVRAGALLGKRALGYLSWRLRRRHEHRAEVLDALRTDLQGLRPDHIAVTGDLTHLGLPHEFAEAARWLQALGGPTDVTVIPGNHDAYAKEPWGDTFACWAPYMAGDGADGGAHAQRPGGMAFFPCLRRRGDVVLISLSSAVPTAPLLATGRLGARQLGRLEALLGELRDAGLFRVVLVHHPPAAHTVGWRKSLTDAAALRDVLARQGADLVLHGHAHITAAAYLGAAGGGTLAIGAPSTSLLHHEVDRYARYHVYRIAREPIGWRLRVAVRAYAPERGRFEPASGSALRALLGR